jgi:hypothetical protein
MGFVSSTKSTLNSFAVSSQGALTASFLKLLESTICTDHIGECH